MFKFVDLGLDPTDLLAALLEVEPLVELVVAAGELELELLGELAVVAGPLVLCAPPAVASVLVLELVLDVLPDEEELGVVDAPPVGLLVGVEPVPVVTGPPVPVAPGLLVPATPVPATGDAVPVAPPGLPAAPLATLVVEPGMVAFMY